MRVMIVDDDYYIREALANDPSHASRQLALRSGAFDSLVKPLDIAEVFRALERASCSPNGARSAELSA